VIEPEREVGQVEGRCDVPPSGSLVVVLSKSNIELRGEVGQLPALERGSAFSPAGSMVVVLESTQCQRVIIDKR
jgi:hypothetical protein